MQRQTIIAYTPAQERAITTHDRDLVVVAGAGSGKTLVLVERFLALLDADPNLKLNAIAAITFTEKAAAEMRERVRLGLQKRAESAGGEGAERWSARLAAMDSARIGTIHSLCSTILRANAAEAGIDPAFDVLDEIQAGLMRAEAVDDALRGANESVQALLETYDGGKVRSALLGLVVSETLPAPEPVALMEAWDRRWEQGTREAIDTFLGWYDACAYATWAGPVPDGDKIGDVWRACAEVLNGLRLNAHPTESVGTHNGASAANADAERTPEPPPPRRPQGRPGLS
ncbi:MAG: UvrD-helicase domain-containing protein [Chloroflexi bacterium]|nr:UvrD-helicase domain-containing protein [Chloroflexota bacterium]